MKLEMTLKHGETGKQDVRVELTDEGLMVREYERAIETRDQVVRLDRWQVRRLAEALNFWLAENEL